MNTENEQKDTELNESELWDLLKDPPETELPGKKKKEKPAKADPAPEEQPSAAPEEPKQKTVITEKRKCALVWYLVGLFGIAFVVVLLSLFLRGQTNDPSGTDPAENSIQIQELYDRINELEEENESLKTENEELTAELMEKQEMMDNLNIMIDELSNSLEYTENAQFYTEDNEKYQRTLTAYKTLVRAQNAFIDYDEEVLETAMKELESMLDVLSDEGKNAYYMVIEYMEQPYLGQE